MPNEEETVVEMSTKRKKKNSQKISLHSFVSCVSECVFFWFLFSFGILGTDNQ